MSREENKNIGKFFILTAVFSVITPFILIVALSDFVIVDGFLSLGEDDDAIWYVIGTFVICGLFGLLCAYMVFNKKKNNITKYSKGLAYIFLPILIFGTGFGLFYLGGTIVSEQRGPYLSWMDDPTTTMTVTFEIKSPGDYILHYGTSETTLGSQILFVRSEMRTEDGYYHYTANITGLTANTKYYYNIPNLYEPVSAFKTAPNIKTTSFKFLLYGDSREDNKILDNQHYALLDQLENQMDITELAFAINTGDTAREHNNPKLWNYHFDAIRDIAKSVPYFVASGNHEWNDGDSWNLDNQPALDIQDFPIGNNPAVDVYSLNEISFSFAYANSFFIFLGYPHAGSNNTAYMTWLEQQLAIGNSSYDFTFVSLHKPPFDDREGENDDDNLDIIKNECPLFHNYSVEAVFNGHNHLLAHQNITWSGDANNRVVSYIISGGGGAPLRNPQYGTWSNTYGQGFSGKTVYCKGTYSYYIVEINGAAATATFTAYELGGAVLEQFTLAAYN